MATELAQLLAREAIRDLPVRYCDCAWRNDIDGIVDLFAADGSFTAVFDGREAAVECQQAFVGHDLLHDASHAVRILSLRS